VDQKESIMGGSFARIVSFLFAVLFVTSGLQVLGDGLGVKFIPIGDLPGGPFLSEARDVSANGSIVVGTGNNDVPAPNSFNGFRFEAVKWTADSGLTGLGSDLGVRGTASWAISGDGKIVVGNIFDEYPDRSVFTWTQSEGMKRLSGCSCVSFDTADDVSFDGSVIVGRMATASGYHAYRWTSGTGAIDLGFLPGGSGESDALGVSYDGSVVVGTSATDKYFQAFRWTQQDGMVPLGERSNRGGSSANAVSADGSVVVGDDLDGAAMWTVHAGTVATTRLGAATARDISADGRVVVGASFVAGAGPNGTVGDEASRWTEQSGMQSIPTILERLGVNLEGWKLSFATGVSADGSVIVGSGINPDGNNEGWIAVIPPTYVPEPSTMTMTLIGAAALIGGVSRFGRSACKRRTTCLSATWLLISCVRGSRSRW
jgi:probable HAF family extracellular repeat protein